MPTTPTTPAEGQPEPILCHECLEPSTDEFMGYNWCESCLNEESTECTSCGDRHLNDDIYSVDRLDEYLCNSCFHERFFHCDNCGEPTENEEGMDVPGRAGHYCPNCTFAITRNQRERPATLEALDLQSKTGGQIVKSKRRFGVELETIYSKSNSIQELMSKISPSWGFHGDGSLRANKNGVGTIEIVSPVLSGKAGEEEINRLTESARKSGFFVNSSCGFHLHLEALDFKRNPKADKKEAHPDIADKQFAYEITEPDGFVHRVETIEQVPTYRNSGGSRTLLPHKIVEIPRDNKIITNIGEEFYRLRDLWYIYLAFDDVMRGMQPPSRRDNSFCRATATLYSISDVRDLRDFNELEMLWYKIDKRYKVENRLSEAVQRKGNLKDQTRYSGFNLAPILSRNGKTIEIRYHSPTLNSEKILRWVDIHQTILDKVSTGSWDEAEVQRVYASETNVLKKAKAMCAIFGIRKETEEYMIERLHKFNQFNKENSELVDEEVSDSDMGRPNHDGGQPLMSRPGGATTRRTRTTADAPDFAIFDSLDASVALRRTTERHFNTNN